MNRRLVDSELIEAALTREAPWCESHGAQDGYVGTGLLYYTLTYATRADVAPRLLTCELDRVDNAVCAMVSKYLCRMEGRYTRRTPRHVESLLRSRQ